MAAASGLAVWALAVALRQPGVLAARPRRELVMTGRPWQVRCEVAQIESTQNLAGPADRTRISDLTARLRACCARARDDYLAWLRDESSRIAARPPAPSAHRPELPVIAVPRQLDGQDHVPRNS